uniref:dihydrofolate reductase n=1 Tax=viral metagenome TaxID=1070528 RepID=A0A6C0JC43_9ZZZZ|tara:strand:- start:1563 stop:2105 length:543 start_codon:yes stop_codon:yes gene_type:complete
MNIVVAVCKNGGIGIHNTLPWNLPKDLKYFKYLTRCHGKNAIVMGKNTCFSLPRALPKRANYVLSTTLKNDKNKFNIINDIGCIKQNKYNNIWLIGGDKVYKSFINSDIINSIYYTDIDENFECDTFFPEIPNKFKRVFTSEKFNENDINYNMKVYVKEGLNPDNYIHKATRALHFTNLG